MMDFTNTLAWIEANPYVVAGVVLLLSLLTFIVARAVLARGLTYLARRTKTEFDDILVEKPRPGVPNLYRKGFPVPHPMAVCRHGQRPF